MRLTQRWEGFDEFTAVHRSYNLIRKPSDAIESMSFELLHRRADSRPPRCESPSRRCKSPSRCCWLARSGNVTVAEEARALLSSSKAACPLTPHLSLAANNTTLASSAGTLVTSRKTASRSPRSPQPLSYFARGNPNLTFPTHIPYTYPCTPT